MRRAKRRGEARQTLAAALFLISSISTSTSGYRSPITQIEREKEKEKEKEKER